MESGERKRVVRNNVGYFEALNVEGIITTTNNLHISEDSSEKG